MSRVPVKPLHVAFVGNPNCGKTTLFNVLTGSHIKVGNWPGVTVEKVEAQIEYESQTINLIDLPGIYSLDSYTPEEKITAEYLVCEEVDLIVNVVDATMLRRNLFLTMQLLQFNKPMIIVLNMMDLVVQKEIRIDLERLSKCLGNIPVIPAAASKGKGIAMLLEAINCQKDWHTDQQAVSQSVDYQIIDQLLVTCWQQPGKKKDVTEWLDHVLLHPMLGIPIFLGIMAIVFWATFYIGDWLKLYLQQGLTWFSLILENAARMAGASEWVISLLTEGALAGVSGVVAFLPNLLVLFLVMALMEDSGYMARVAYLMNDLMSRLGLSGKAFIPMLLGFGCTVPAIMATRILSSKEEQKKTIIILPFMSCSAKLPIYLLMAALFFPGSEALVIYSMYTVSFLLGLLLLFVLRKFDAHLDRDGLLIELPEYKMPSVFSVFSFIREKVADYLGKAGTTIFLASLILWVLLHTNANGLALSIDHSFAASIGRSLVPIFAPAGLGSWQLIVALIAGFSAKEVVVASFPILFGISNLSSSDGLIRLSSVLSSIGVGRLQGLSFLLFCLLYSPCISAMVMVKKEMGLWWMLRMVIFQTVLAWGIAAVFYQIGQLIG